MYFEEVAAKYRLKRFIKFNHRVSAAQWDDERQKYALEVVTADGETLYDECDVLINAAGLLK